MRLDSRQTATRTIIDVIDDTKANLLACLFAGLSWDRVGDKYWILLYIDHYDLKLFSQPVARLVLGAIAEPLMCSITLLDKLTH